MSNVYTSNLQPICERETAGRATPAPRRVQTAITTKSPIKKMKTDNPFVSQNYPVRYKIIHLNELDIFYREAGPQNAPTLLLLHGFPTSLTCSGILYRALPHHSMWLLPTILASVKAVCRVTRISLTLSRT